MRAEDERRLSQDYPPDEPVPGRLARALDVDLPAWRELRDRIFADLDECRFGIGWWAPLLGPKRRILISDYLFACADSVETNMIEAKLHLLEAMDFWERESEFHARCVTIGPGGQPQICLPERRRPLDDVQHEMPRLHAIGCVRALASALDCCGAVIVGVAALPMNILRADFRRARQKLGSIADSSPGAQAQRTLWQQLERAIDNAGPRGWLEWLITLRNMYVHRGRRIQLSVLRPVPSGVVDVTGRTIIRTDVIPKLPRDPDWSDLQMFLDLNRPPVLEEKAEVTLAGALDSTRRLLDEGGRLLLELWMRRRADPTLLPQPREQWPRVELPEPVDFRGYAPGSFPHSASQLRTHGDVLRRLKAAALDDAVRGQWATFD